MIPYPLISRIRYGMPFFQSNISKRDISRGQLLLGADIQLTFDVIFASSDKYAQDWAAGERFCQKDDRWYNEILVESASKHKVR